MSPLSKSADGWLKNAEAASILCVDPRTIKRWMKSPAKREALLAVQYGKQFRIPRPAELCHWEFYVRRNFKALGIPLKEPWEKGLEDLGKEFSVYALESYRLWLAAHLQLASEREQITEEDITNILLLWQTACKLLSSRPRGVEVDAIKSEFRQQLVTRHLSQQEIDAAMLYWPKDAYLSRVRAARTLKHLEKIRRGLDTLQATRELQRLGQKPTAENLRPLFHKNIMEHINDTKEKLPLGTINAQTAGDLTRIIQADVMAQMHGGVQRRIVEGRDDQGRTFGTIEISNAPGQPELPTFVDLREPQNGLALRTFRKRHPLRKPPQRDIIAVIQRTLDAVPGIDQPKLSGKTPNRGGAH